MKKENILLYNNTFAKYLGWEISTKAKRLKKRKLFTEEIGNGYWVIHPDDIFFDKSWELLNRVINKLTQNGVYINITNKKTTIDYNYFDNNGISIHYSDDESNKGMFMNTYRVVYNVVNHILNK